ncbi:hypothetical protein [Peijinzhouia sedimentorum]|tara:strand:- start:253 stop:465 length:213 start_codon:yes stop_codon:yes gene_type:complete
MKKNTAFIGLVLIFLSLGFVNNTTKATEELSADKWKLHYCYNGGKITPRCNIPDDLGPCTEKMECAVIIE